MRIHARLTVVAVACCLAAAPCARAADLLVGTATVDITPAKPVALCGQFQLRIAREVETPLTANAIALESRTNEVAGDVAIMVSCDVVGIPPALLAMVRERVHQQLPDLDTTRIFLSGTHTHTAPELEPGVFRIPTDGVMQVEEYQNLFADRVAGAIAQAWAGRQPGRVTWGLSHAVVAYNRRAVYADGRAQMYGPTDVPDFRNLEGYEDHDVGSLFFFDAAGTLIGVAINVACTAQEVEARSAVNADFWHPVRRSLRERFGPQLCVLGWIGAAGDQSPHLMYRAAADERMRRLRGLDRLDEIARRIVRAVDEAYEVVKDDQHADVPLIHKVESLELPMRLVTEAECAEAKGECTRIEAALAQDPAVADQEFRRLKWYADTVARYEAQQAHPQPVFPMELHVVRIGDAVICTNAFELFTDYGIRMKAGSKAEQTFIIQLAGQGTYLPTEKAVRGGHYSAIVHSSHVGPDGGQMLVERTIALVSSLWIP